VPSRDARREGASVPLLAFLGGVAIGALVASTVILALPLALAAQLAGSAP